MCEEIFVIDLITSFYSDKQKLYILQFKNVGKNFRLISTGQLNALLRLHTQPINLVIFKESYE